MTFINKIEVLAQLVEKGDELERKLEDQVRIITANGRIDPKKYYDLVKPQPPILYARKNPHATTPQYAIIAFDEPQNATYTINISLASKRCTVAIWNGKIPTPPPYTRLKAGFSLAQLTELPKLLFKEEVEEFHTQLQEYAQYLSMDYSLAKGEKRVITLDDKFVVAFQDDLKTPGMAFAKGEQDIVATGKLLVRDDHPQIAKRAALFKDRYDTIVDTAIHKYPLHHAERMRAMRDAIASSKAQHRLLTATGSFIVPSARLDF